jgi:hypothetical protein
LPEENPNNQSIHEKRDVEEMEEEKNAAKNS